LKKGGGGGLVEGEHITKRYSSLTGLYVGGGEKDGKVPPGIAEGVGLWGGELRGAASRGKKGEKN